MPPLILNLADLNLKRPSNRGIGPWNPSAPLPAPILHIAGVTKDSAGTALGSCSVELYNTATDMPLERVTSDAATGAYSVSSVGLGQTYYVVAYKAGGGYYGSGDYGAGAYGLGAGGADVAGTTVNTLVGV